MPTIADQLTLPCGAVLSNRLAKAAMTEGLADAQGRPTPELERLYRLWSQGGAGMLLTGNVQIDRRHLERPGNVIIDAAPDADMRARLASWARGGTEAGNHLWMQISHAGRQTPRVVNATPRAPSAVPLGIPGKQFGNPVALTEPEIHDIIQRFATACVAARETGFTGVQIHSAHGYLLSEFLSPRSNVRTDDWGGRLENRARLLLEVVRLAREKLGADYPIAVKLNSADFQKGGFAFEDSLTVAEWLQGAGVDLIELSGGNYEQPRLLEIAGLEPLEEQNVKRSTLAREAYFVDFAKAMRGQVRIPMMVTGGFRRADAMNEAIASGAAEVIGLGRPMCVDTDAPRKLLEGAPELARWEKKLRLLPPALQWAKRFPLVRAVDGFATIYWFYAQLYRLGRDGTTDPGLSVFKAWREVEKRHGELLRGMR